MPFAKAKLSDSYLVGLEGVSKRIIVLEDPNLGRRIGFDFSEVPFLTLWADKSDVHLHRAVLGFAGQQSAQAIRGKDRNSENCAGRIVEARFFH